MGTLLLSFVLGAAACAKKRIPPPPPLPPPQPQELVEAEARFAAGDWTAAANLYQSLLASPGDLDPAEVDEIHFRLGLIHSNPSSSLWDPAAAEEILSPLAQAAGGPYQSQASVLLTLLQELTKVEGQYSATKNQLQRVSDELEKMKEIERARRNRRP